MSDHQARIDLNALRVVFRQKSWGTIFGIVFCISWALIWIYFSYFHQFPPEDASSPSDRTKHLVGLFGPIVLVVAFYLIQFYINDHFIIDSGELTHIGINKKVKFRTALTEITSVKIVDDYEEWTCRVEYGGNQSFYFSNTLQGHREFGALLKAIADQNWRTSRDNARWISDPLK